MTRHILSGQVADSAVLHCKQNREKVAKQRKAFVLCITIIKSLQVTFYSKKVKDEVLLSYIHVHGIYFAT